MDTTQIQSQEHRLTGRLLRQSSFLLFFSLALGILVWALVARYGRLPAFLLPAPMTVFDRFVTALQDGSLASNTLATLEEVLPGWLLEWALQRFWVTSCPNPNPWSGSLHP
jgi:ABC-type nitrate/sulfonate/bicarbonate transport system permease component